ncbi:MAG: hypothetical protein K2I06_06540 [Ruminococcus sp.]|nr:hypothetical protein [Ruminococcus sp.]
MKKIPTLFRRVFGENKVIDVLPEINKGCEKAFLHGEATLKWDGACCAVINGIFYRRYDAKNGKPVCKIKRTDFDFEWNGRGGAT